MDDFGRAGWDESPAMLERPGGGEGLRVPGEEERDEGEEEEEEEKEKKEEEEKKEEKKEEEKKGVIWGIGCCALLLEDHGVRVGGEEWEEWDRR